MKLEEVIPYIQNIKNVDIAKTILEVESDPEGYYENIYQTINEALHNNASEEELMNIFDNYERYKAIKHFQYMLSIHDEIKGSKLQSLFHKTTFLNAINNISDIYSLRLYLTLLNKELKNEDINYKKYVPEYKSICVN